jgi:ATP-binding cassette subfamily F protein 3
MQPNNFLLLDEPTTHLDIAAREALEEALQNYDGTLCLVSHDIAFVRNVATTIFHLTPGKITRYYGNYDYFRQKLAEEALRAQGAGSTAPQTPRPSVNPKERRKEDNLIRQQFAVEIKRLKEKVEKSEKDVAKAEKELGELFLKLSSNAPGTDYEALNKRLPVVQRILDNATKEWEDSSRKLEQLLHEREQKLNS